MRSPLNPSQRIATRLKWLDIAPYVSKVAPELHPADFRASGLRCAALPCAGLGLRSAARPTPLPAAPGDAAPRPACDEPLSACQGAAGRRRCPWPLLWQASMREAAQRR